MVCQVGFKIFLNITPTITNWTSDNKQFSLVFDENPLADFVELPDDGRAQDELWYSNILCGVLRGALEMVCTLFLYMLIYSQRTMLGILSENFASMLCKVKVLICRIKCRSKCRLKRTSSVTFYAEMIPLR